MVDAKLRVGIAGYGVVGKRRRTYIDAHPKLKVVAVCDQLYKEQETNQDGLVRHSDYQSLLKENLDILFVSLPNYLAADVTIAGLKCGLHVFCEKPPGRDVHDIERVIVVEKECGGLLKYGFNHRYHRSVQDVLKILQSGELGDVINLRGVYGKSKIIPFSGGWRSDRAMAGGGILLDQGIHMVDLMQLFCGNFVEVKSFISNDFWKHDVEDNAYALMKDDKGRIASLHSSATQWQHMFSLEIAMTEGYIELKGILSGSKSYGEEKLIVGRKNELDTGTEQVTTTTYLEDPSWKDEVWEFADAILNGQPIEHGTSVDALKTMQLVYDIYWSDPEWREKYNIPKTNKR